MTTLNNLLKKSKKKFYWDKFKACIGDSRQTYKLLNDLRGLSSDAQTVPALISCLQRQSEPTAEDIADKFNHYVTTIAKDIKAALPETALPVLPSVEKSMFLYEVSNAEVKLIIDQLDNKSSSGDDNVNNLIAKTSAPVVIPYLTHLINKSLSRGIFPSELTKAKILPFHKDGSKDR